MLFLFNLNVVLKQLGAMLPDETLRHETRQFTALNRWLLGLLLLLIVAYVRSAPRPAPAAGTRRARSGSTSFGFWGLTFFALLPLAMTMALIWKTKETILDSVLREVKKTSNLTVDALRMINSRSAYVQCLLNENRLSAWAAAPPPPISWLMQTALTRPKLISLAAGFTDNATLPVEISRKLLNRNFAFAQNRPARAAIRHHRRRNQFAATHRATFAEIGPDPPRARPRPRKKNRGRERRTRTIQIHSPERVIITGGSQQLLYMTLEALCDEGDIILVEDPTYFVFLSILQSRGIKARGVKLERDGIDLAHLEKVLERLKKSGELRRVKALYLVTYFQNPTGATTSLRQKIRRAETVEKIRARRRTSDLSARRRRVSRTAL